MPTFAKTVRARSGFDMDVVSPAWLMTPQWMGWGLVRLRVKVSLALISRTPAPRKTKTWFNKNLQQANNYTLLRTITSPNTHLGDKRINQSSIHILRLVLIPGSSSVTVFRVLPPSLPPSTQLLVRRASPWIFQTSCMSPSPVVARWSANTYIFCCRRLG